MRDLRLKVKTHCYVCLIVLGGEKFILRSRFIFQYAQSGHEAAFAASAIVAMNHTAGDGAIEIADGLHYSLISLGNISIFDALFGKFYICAHARNNSSVSRPALCILANSFFSR